MQRVSVIVLFLVFLSACKKDKLEGDDVILIGKWKWIYTDKLDNTYPFTNNSSYSPITENKNYSIEFTHTGRIYTYENSKKKDCFRIVFDPPPPSHLSAAGGYAAYIFPDNKKKKSFLVGKGAYDDTLCIDGFFPFKEDDPDNFLIHNYFIREN